MDLFLTHEKRYIRENGRGGATRPHPKGGYDDGWHTWAGRKLRVIRKDEIRDWVSEPKSESTYIKKSSQEEYKKYVWPVC